MHLCDAEYVLNLRHHRTLFQNSMAALVVGADGVERPFTVDVDNYWIGSVVGDPESNARLYISSEGAIHGRIHAFGEDFVLEFAHRHYPKHG